MLLLPQCSRASRAGRRTVWFTIKEEVILVDVPVEAESHQRMVQSSQVDDKIESTSEWFGAAA